MAGRMALGVPGNPTLPWTSSDLSNVRLYYIHEFLDIYLQRWVYQWSCFGVPRHACLLDFYLRDNSEHLNVLCSARRKQWSPHIMYSFPDLSMDRIFGPNRPALWETGQHLQIRFITLCKVQSSVVLHDVEADLPCESRHLPRLLPVVGFI
jgi:hypothetical protein